MDKYQDKYRIPSARLQNWNYGESAAYFITICTKNREHFFGEIVNNEMKKNNIGELAEKEWTKSITLRPDMNIELGLFVIMPNHLHGIIIIGDNQFNKQSPLQDGQTLQQKSINKFGPQTKNLSSIIRGFKSSVTIQARNITRFAWQPLYHEHIIRNNKNFDEIQQYIFNNPNHWKEDKFYS